MAFLFSERFQALDASGNPLSGAMLYFYRGSTSSAITTYQDADATTPHASPVVADATGTFPAIFLNTVNDYKFILKDAAGITIATVDDIPVGGQIDAGALAAAVVDAEAARDEAQAAASSVSPTEYPNIATAQALTPVSAPDFIRTAGYTTAGDGGGALYKKVASEPAHAGKFQIAEGSWYAIAQSTVATKMFGAKADGATDDVAAIHAAVGYCKTISNPHLVLSDGIHQCATAVIIDLPEYSTVTFIGSIRSTLSSGVAVTIGKSTHTFGLTINNADVHRPLPVSGACGLELLNLVFAKGSIRRTYGFTWGVRCNGTHANGGFSYNQFTMGYHHDSVINLFLTASGSGYCNENTFYGGSYNHTSSWGTTDGSVNIEVDHFATSPLNNNRFICPSLEDSNSIVYARAANISGINNLIFHPRMENPTDLDGYFINLSPNSYGCQVLGLGNGLNRSNVSDQGTMNSIQTLSGDIIKRGTPAGEDQAVHMLQSVLTSSAYLLMGLNSSGAKTSSIDGDGNAVFAGYVDMGALRFDGSATSASPAAGGAGALPATPAGYVSVMINGASRLLAYY